MKQWIRRILLCLALGLASAVVVAWGCGVWVDPGRAPFIAIGFSVDESPEPGADVVTSYGTDVQGAGVLVRIRHRYTADGLLLTIEDRRGWPFPCLRSWHEELRGSREITGAMPTNLAPFDTSEGAPALTGLARVLPLEPVWSPLALNTLLYAIAILPLVLGVTAWRRHSRRRRGRCVACGYDLKSDLARGCPECGWNRHPDPELDPVAGAGAEPHEEAATLPPTEGDVL